MELKKKHKTLISALTALC